MNRMRQLRSNTFEMRLSIYSLNVKSSRSCNNIFPALRFHHRYFVSSITKIFRLASSSLFSTPTDLPVLYYNSNSSTIVSLLSYCSHLFSPYHPTRWMKGPHAQTLLGALFRSRMNVEYERVILKLKDGGQAALDWDRGGGGRGREAEKRVIHTSPCHLSAQDFSSHLISLSPSTYDLTTPIVLIIPGLTGHSNVRYILHLIHSFREYPYRSVVLNYRGVTLSATTPRPSTGVDISDIISAIQYINEAFPNAPISIIGYSMGANMLVKALGELGDESLKYNIVGCMAISNSFDYVKLSNSLENNWFNQLLYSRLLTFQLKRNIFTSPYNIAMFGSFTHPTMVLNLEYALKAKTIRVFDDRLTRILYGINKVDDYYDQQSSERHLPNVKVPLLCLNSLDDPFKGSLPFEISNKNNNLLFVTTQQGGHVAHVTGWNPSRIQNSWMNQLAKQCWATHYQRKNLYSNSPIFNSFPIINLIF